MYDDQFYATLAAGSRRSAEAIVPLIKQFLAPRSVLDVGCGQGLWLAVWHQHGIDDVMGVDGAYVDRTRLAIPAEKFTPCDLAAGFDQRRQFDVVTSFEVAEHLPASAAALFVEHLCQHSDMVVFSAAVPGQGGLGHINEQPYDYWRRLFSAQGYVCCDLLRPLIHRDCSIEPWYRFNVLVYVRAARLNSLPEAVRTSLVPEDKPVPEVADWLWRTRCRICSWLPTQLFMKLCEVVYWTLKRFARAER